MKTRCTVILLLLVFPAMISESIAQEVTKSKPAFGVRVSANFDNIFFSKYHMDYWILRSTPGLFVEYKNHDFQIGPAHAHFINNPGWFFSTKFNSNAMGFSFGYRYYPNEILKRMRMFAQLQVSQFWVKYTSNSMGSGLSEQKETAWCGFASWGVDYRISKRFHVFSGAGIGISSTFHNYTENFYPHLLAGIDYRFGTLKKK
jgi:opacity protein-like surface antigen